MVALFATMSFALTSCGDGDDDEQDGFGGISLSTIIVNGKPYKAFPSADFWGMNGWSPSSKAGNFYIQLVDDDSTIFSFWYNSTKMPSKGDDFSKMSLEMSYNQIIGTADYKYISGSAKITEDTGSGSDRYITIDFDDLTMSNGQQTYTFKGKLKMNFENYDN